MAITKTRSVQRLEVLPAQDTDATGIYINDSVPKVHVEYVNVFDDSEDAELPVSISKFITINKWVVAEDESTTLTDYSSEDALVQAVCGAIWS
jgi:hypothetical protein